MRSRVRVELGLRLVALSALALATLIAWRALRTRPGSTVHGAAPIQHRLRPWTTGHPPGHLRLRFDTLPDGVTRDWLAALVATGSSVTWSADPPALQPTGLAVEPVPDPRRPVRVSVAASPGQWLTVSDRSGLLDSLRAGLRGGSQLVAAVLDGNAVLDAGLSGASARLRDSLNLRPILVLGTGGWEAKFIVAALEERGWTVQARMELAPRQTVSQGPEALSIDTARIGAVIAIDRSASRQGAAIARFVESGGGLVVLNDAAAVPAFAPLLPAAGLGALLNGGSFTSDSTLPRAGLALRPLERLVQGAVVLERQGTQAVVAIRQAGAGRVIQVGYENIWRWRMAARADSTLSLQQRWWSALVGSVAYTPRVPLAAADTDLADPAPLADLVASLGPPQPGRNVDGSALLDPKWLPILFGLVLIALVIEWLSRRLRGEP